MYVTPGETVEVVPPSFQVVGPPASATKIDFYNDSEVVRVVAEGERLGYGHLFNPALATEISMIDLLPTLPSDRMGTNNAY